ncbi:uncharacterized protein LOC116194318 [Punica granatum]|uniref:Uncharacterized protein LOC116194318 n=1 Tax=Punica granatum TaxID=22663 RepID=A0A6P8CD79_PUNGR|nr:uncharacterized protein LOC116194318 [Punica granatum]
MLRDYAHEILRSNPGSTVLLQVELETHEFERLYICLKACKRGFQEGCRPIIGLDGYFLKCYYGDQLLSVISQDGNNSFFIIAYAVVEVECTESWKWFLQNLIFDVGDPIDKKYTFISDMQKGLDIAIKEVCDGIPHRFCNRHIWANMTKHAKCNGGELRRAFWNCAKTTTLQRFTQCMNALRMINQTAVEYLRTIDSSRWSMSVFDTVCKYDALTSNMCEQFNKELLKVRGKPILTLVERVREYITRKKIRCQTLLGKYNRFLCPKVQAILEEHNKNSNGWVPLWVGDPHMSQFEITCSPFSKCAVDMKAHSCSCRVWDLTGISCKHTIAAMLYNS